MRRLRHERQGPGRVRQTESDARVAFLYYDSNLRPESTAKLGVEEALQILLVDFGFARRHIAQLAGFHPAFQLIHQAEQVIERIDDEQQRLVVVDLKALINGPFQLDRDSAALPALRWRARSRHRN